VIDVVSSAALAGVVLGEVALLFDLANRLFGSYVRTPVACAVRILAVVLACLALASPACFAHVRPDSTAGRALFHFTGLLGGLLFIHFLFPYRWGIRRVREPKAVGTIKPLTTGLALREATVEVRALPPGLDRFTVLAIADAHCNGERQLALLAECLKGLAGRPPDCVFVLGDLGEREDLLPGVVQAVSAIPSRFGTFVVRGNHDCEGWRHQAIQELLGKNRVALLTNETRVLPGVDVALIGLEHPWHRSPLPRRPDADLVIGLSHTPDNIHFLRQLGAHVCVAGHTHGGALRLPFIGPLLVASRLGRFLDQGPFRLGETLLWVTPGVGYFLGRPRNRGEILRLTIATHA
jgi:predicted MPP superfamily phosphohydrolase